MYIRFDRSFVRSDSEVFKDQLNYFFVRSVLFAMPWPGVMMVMLADDGNYN